MKEMSYKEQKPLLGTDRYYVGIDAGSVSLNCIVVNDKREVVYESPYNRHMGKVEERLLALLQDLYEKFGERGSNLFPLRGITGRNSASNWRRSMNLIPLARYWVLFSSIQT